MEKVWTAVLYDADQQGYPYLKRFYLESNNRKQNVLGENKDSELIALSSESFPRFKVTFGQGDSFREPLIVDADTFVGIKSFKAKGKRISTFAIESIEEVEPIKQDSPKEVEEKEAETETEPQANAQMTLFDD